MFFWMFLDLFVFFLLCISQVSKEYVSKICCYITVVVLFLLTVFRYETGTDTMNYIECFYFQYFDLDNISMEYTFEMIVELLKMGGFSSQILFVVYGIPTYWFFWKGLRYYLDTYRNTMLGLFFFSVSLWGGFWQTMNTMRAMLAIMIIFYGSRYLVENIKWKYCLFLGLATLFHYSAVVSVILLIFPYLKINKLVLFLGVIISFVLMKCGVDELPYALAMYGIEITRGTSRIGVESGLGMSFMLIMCEVMLCVYFSDYKNRKNNFMIFMVMVGIYTRIALFNNVILSGRISELFSGGFPVVQTYAANLLSRDEKIRKIFILFVSLILIYAHLNASYEPLLIEKGPMADPYQYEYRIEIFGE